MPIFLFFLLLFGSMYAILGAIFELELYIISGAILIFGSAYWAGKIDEKE